MVTVNIAPEVSIIKSSRFHIRLCRIVTGRDLENRGKCNITGIDMRDIEINTFIKSCVYFGIYRIGSSYDNKLRIRYLNPEKENNLSQPTCEEPIYGLKTYLTELFIIYEFLNRRIFTANRTTRVSS